jgi:hypothetical protein
MGRIRSIKPEFWTSDQVMECSRDARLLFIGLWNFSDDAGRLPYNAKQIKALVFPGDDDPVSRVAEWLEELERNDLVVSYIVANKRYLQITGWHHQKIDRPQKAKYPDPSTNGSVVSREIVEDSTIIRRTFDDHSSVDRIGEDKGKDKDAVPAAPAPKPPDAELFQRGKQILGANSGGLIRRLLASKGGNIPIARAALETASQKADPREYIGAIVASRQREPETMDGWIT